MRTALTLPVALSLAAPAPGAQDIDFTTFHMPAEVDLTASSRSGTPMPTDRI